MAKHTKLYTILAGSALLGAGAVGGAVLAIGPSAGATVSAKAPAVGLTKAQTPPPATGPWAMGRDRALSHSGTVTAASASTVTIRAAAGTTTYTVASDSDIDKNGESSVSALKVGDAVTFATTTPSSTTIAVLHAGQESMDFPHGGPGFGGPDFGGRGLWGHDFGRGSAGTVSAVTASTVTIRTTAGTKTYTVASTSDIDKNGESSLSALKVGDAVTFVTTTSSSTTIAVLHSGKASLDFPGGRSGFGGPGFADNGLGGPGSASEL